MTGSKIAPKGERCEALTTRGTRCRHRFVYSVAGRRVCSKHRTATTFSPRERATWMTVDHTISRGIT